MFDEFFQKPKRRHIKDLNLVPIIDMFTTVVFFLLLSSSFDFFSKVTLPPSATVSVATPDDASKPLSPKLVLVRNSPKELELILNWEGEKPGSLSEIIPVERGAERKMIQDLSKKIVTKFTKDHNAEKALQIGLDGEINYQSLIAVIDGVVEVMPNIVLISYNDTVKDEEN
jgi:biopolymer transport protein ExbD